jgi:hypothetical protein
MQLLRDFYTWGIISVMVEHLKMTPFSGKAEFDGNKIRFNIDYSVLHSFKECSLKLEYSAVNLSPPIRRIYHSSDDVKSEN